MSERRSADRFPIEQEVRYRAVARQHAEEPGSGKTVNMSSSGILFQTSAGVPLGKQIEVSVSWPAQLNNKTALKLVARGRVVRVEDNMAALEIQHYEFRTKATATN
jgi:c-di-GMP-binding flagellar brake protein YcgR